MCCVVVDKHCYTGVRYELSLVARAWRAVCPEGLDAGIEEALKNGRNLWMGCVTNLDIVHGQPGPTCSLSLNVCQSLLWPISLPERSLFAKLLTFPPNWNKQSSC